MLVYMGILFTYIMPRHGVTSWFFSIISGGISTRSDFTALGVLRVVLPLWFLRQVQIFLQLFNVFTSDGVVLNHILTNDMLEVLYSWTADDMVESPSFLTSIKFTFGVEFLVLSNAQNQKIKVLHSGVFTCHHKVHVRGGSVVAFTLLNVS